MNVILDEDQDEDFDLDECGFSYEHGCQLAATEFCEWECPFHSEYVLWMGIKKIEPRQSE